MVGRLIAAACAASPAADHLGKCLVAETGTRLADWIDSITVPATAMDMGQLQACGFLPDPHPDASGAWRHPGGRLPRIISGTTWRLTLAADDLSVCRQALGAGDMPIPGPGPTQTRLFSSPGAEVWACSRQGFYRSEQTAQWYALLSSWRVRGEIPAAAYARGHRLLLQAVDALGSATACDLFFAAERDRWQRRNHAAAAQKWRQDRFGLGWANTDHHTFRSSRRHFRDLIHALEMLGLQCRERFHAGAEAGWGAQVLEHPQTGVVVFADVDLAPDEIAGDIAHVGLPEQQRLGTVGLWCALHGDSFLDAGLHHLACLGDFDQLQHVVQTHGDGCMAPFSTKPYLHQAFTTGEMWPVATDRLAPLVQTGAIDQATAERIARDGARGSHLELIERNDGFKGFNQHGVSHIITATDPRR